MSHTMMIISAVMLIAFAIAFAPGVIGLNRGHILRNIALWLGIFLALGLFYKQFGPESPHPLFHAPDSMVGLKPAGDTSDAPPVNKDNKDEGDEGSKGFTPPND